MKRAGANRRNTARAGKRRQYTLRGVPDEIDSALRERARSEGRSVNAVLIDLLRNGLRPGGGDAPCNDLGQFAGSWVEDPAFDEAQRDFDRVDDELWR